MPAARPDPRILVLGANGQIGRELVGALRPLGEVIPATRELVDLSRPQSIRATIQTLAPQVIVNAAAYTNVDRAEAEREICFRVNAEAPEAIALAARELDALIVHYSSDYVFDGAKESPYCEDDETNPLSVYGESKRGGELAIQRVGGRWLILRTSWVFGMHGKNFLRTMLRVAREDGDVRIVDDQTGAPTSSRAIADGTSRVLESVLTEERRAGERSTRYGMYHMTASGRATWFDFARAIFAADPDRHEHRFRSLTSVSAADFGAPARRPANSELNCTKLDRTFNVRLPSWFDQLRMTLNGAE